jgi:DNA-binding response OmpR family regulator
MHILVVDDDKVMRDAVSYTLRADGFSVITAADGIEALDILQNKEVSLIISDVLMPNLSGLGLLSVLKRFYFERIPVILISALDKGEVILSAMGLGAADFIIKPVSLEELKLRIKKVLGTSY